MKKVVEKEMIKIRREKEKKNKEIMKEEWEKKMMAKERCRSMDLLERNGG